MGAKITLNGNLGGDPRSGEIQGRDGKPLPWVSFSMWQSHRTRNDNDEYVDTGGFWMNIVWFDWRAGMAARLLKKGAAVIISGDLHVEVWVDKDTGEQKAAYKVNADEVSLDMRSLADVTYRQRSTERGPQPQPNVGNNNPGGANAAARNGNAATQSDGFEDLPQEFMHDAPPQGENVTPPAGAHANPGENHGGGQTASTDTPSFPVDDDRPI